MSIDSKRNIIESKCVFIDGKDIQMPLTSGNFDPQENRTYSFYIWAYDQDEPTSKTLNDLRLEGKFSVDVIGVKASISVPEYGSGGTPPQQLLDSLTNGASIDTLQAMKSHNVLQVQIKSQDITGPFTIIAWFPEKYRNWHPANSDDTTSSAALPANPYGDKREVKVYNGDLRTRIDIVDEREAESSFGTLFPKYFYIGRIYLRNRHPDKRMVVYTTSMRANVLLYRPPVPTAPTANPPTPSGKYAAPTPISTPAQYAQADLTHSQRAILNTNQFIQGQQKTNQLILQKMVGTAFDQYYVLTEEEQRPRARHDPWLRHNRAIRILNDTADRFPAVPDNLDRDDLATRVLLVWQRLDEAVNSAQQQADQASAEAFSLIRTELAAVPSGSAQDQVARLNVAPVLLQLGGNGNPSEILGFYVAATNGIAKAGLSVAEQKRLQSLASRAYELREYARQREFLASALQANSALLKDNTVSPAVAQEFQADIDKISSEALENSQASPNPFAKARPVNVNADARQLALSEDQTAQVALAKVGYLWHETYRPMTFQAVLNSLMYTDENSYSARTARFLQSAATIAGGMVGLGNAVPALSSMGYLQGVNFFSAVFVPEAGRLLLDDLNKHIRNLGEMAMDTVVVVPPNDVVDQYVFFPKGPIFNFADEFNVTDPAYIKNIDNDDVGIEATLIDQGVTVQGGSLDSATLVDRALNEGEADLSADMLKQQDLKDRLRQMELTTIASQITSLLNAQPAGTNGAKSSMRLSAEKQACKLVQSFAAQFGEDTTGILDNILTTNHVSCDNSPPTAGTIPTLDVLPGVRSTAFQLPVSDVLGTWTLAITNISSNPDFINPTNVLVTMPNINSSAPATFTLQAATNAALAQDAEVTVTFMASNVMALTTPIPAKVVVHTPQFRFLPLPGLQGVRDVAGANLDLSNTNSVTFVNVVLPVYDSDLSGGLGNWSYQVLSQTNTACQTNGWNITLTGLQPTGMTGGQSGIALGLAIDPSMATTSELPLPIAILYGGKVIASTNMLVQAVPLESSP